MRSTRCLVTAALALLAPVLPFRSLAAQHSGTLVADVRTGFAGFPWGATAEEIATRLGRPAVDTVARDYRRLVYHDSAGAAPAEIWYLLHPSRGLMAGQFGIEKPATGCQDVYKRVRKDVEAANPGLKKKEEFKRNLEIACDKAGGALLGSWLVAWGDSGSARIQQMMVTGAASISVYYRGPAADAYAAEQRATRGPAIDGFATFPWGTPRDSIVKKLGTPKLVDTTGGTVMVAYLDRLLGEPASVAFTISPVEGLIKGSYLVAVPANYDCDAFYRRFHFALLERFPDITPKLSRTNFSRKPLCEGLKEGKASVSAIWEDPKAEASVTVEMKEPGKHLRITYLGATYGAWLKRTRAADVKNKL